MGTVTPESRAAWRKWLERHHDREGEVWVVFYKKHTGRQGLCYDEAVEEAICFGWIDGILKRIDDEKYMQKFMPRRMNGGWSELNLKRARSLIASGRMTAAGLRKLGDSLEKYEKHGTARRPPLVDEAPPALVALLKKTPAAWANFQKLAPSYRRQHLGWVMAAKKEETRSRRMQELAATLAKGRKLGMK